MVTASTLIAGFGSHHGADTLGWLVLDALQAMSFPGVALRKYRHPTAVVGELAGFERVIFVDALRTEQLAYGEMFQFEARELEASAGLFSSHAQGLNDAISLAATLGVLPAQALVLGSNVAGLEDKPLPDGVIVALAQRLCNLVE